MKKKKATKGILVDVGILLVCLLVVSTCLTSGIFAKFISSAKNIASTSHVAIFDVGASSNDSNVEIDTSEWSKGFKVKVTNRSETAVRYSLKLVFENDVNGIVAAEITVGTETVQGVYEGNNTIVWTDLGTMAQGAASVELPLTITISRDHITQAEVNYNFNAIVTFTQID